MIATEIDATPVLDAKTELGEGQIWDSRRSCLFFVDILRGRVHRFDPSGSALHTIQIDQPVGAVALSEGEDLMLAARDGFARLTLATGRMQMIAAVEADRPDQRMNDGACDPAGRFWAGTMALDERPDAGALYRLDPDGPVERMLRPVTISNGLDWSHDGRRMYFIDSARQAVDVFDFDVGAGSIANRRTAICIPAEMGVPDGLALDADEYIWVALWGGGAVHRYAPDGALD